MLVVVRCWLGVGCVLYVVCRLLGAVCCLVCFLFVVRCSLFAVGCFGVGGWLLVDGCCLYVVCCMLFGVVCIWLLDVDRDLLC